MTSVRPDLLERLKFNSDGLIPAIVQDRLTGEVRMMAWMNRESLEKTVTTRNATFYSRSRQKLWMKGEESGHTLRVHQMFLDCDGDTLLVMCDPAGPSCHTGADNCFFTPLEEGESSPARPLAERLEHVLEARKTSSADKSYTRSLFEGGAEKIGRKITEEAGEVVAALKGESDERVASEAADVYYHLLVGLRLRNVTWRSVLAVLSDRFGVGGHVEKASRK